jgi:hypothetical protein
MTTVNNPAQVRHGDAPNANRSAMDAPRTRVITRRGDETKAFYKTTEFMVFIVATVGVLLGQPRACEVGQPPSRRRLIKLPGRFRPPSRVWPPPGSSAHDWTNRSEPTT